jgi:hypothetical protein
MYLSRENGRERDHIDMRLRIRNHKVVVAGCFDVNRTDDLAKAISYALSDIRPLAALH